MAAILLAAGLSQRMGDTNKLLLEFHGEPLVRRAARIFVACGLDLYVVVGHARDAVETALAGIEASVVANPDYRQGQQTSVRAGIAALDDGYEAALIALADQPLLEAGDVMALIEAFAASDGDKILVPVYDGQRGNPIVVPAAILADIGSGPSNFGCRKFIERNPEQIIRFEAESDHYTIDVDTPEAFEAVVRGRAREAVSS